MLYATEIFVTANHISSRKPLARLVRADDVETRLRFRGFRVQLTRFASSSSESLPSSHLANTSRTCLANYGEAVFDATDFLGDLFAGQRLSGEDRSTSALDLAVQCKSRSPPAARFSNVPSSRCSQQWVVTHHEYARQDTVDEPNFSQVILVEQDTAGDAFS